MVRRLKEDVLTQLPPKNIYFVHLSPDGEIANLVKEEADLWRQLNAKVLNSKELMAIKGHVANVRARLGFLKAPKIAEYIKWLFECGESRVVVFMMHLQAIKRLSDELATANIEPLVLTGNESFSERTTRVNRFQDVGRGKRAIVGQITASGLGLTMTAARYAVLGEISWTPGWNSQAIDRVHRITQTRTVEAPILTFPHAIEERVIRTAAQKALDAQNTLDTNLAALVT
jgi:SNF2 family DNA or RNA helicase